MTTDDTIALVCAKVGEDLDGLVRRLVSRIRSVVPAYAAVAYEDQYDYIRAEFVIMLDCLARGAALPDELVEETRELGKRRAQQGMTLQDVVQSYHLGLKAIWSGLVEQGGDAGPALLDASSYLWDNVHVLTSAVADGHSDATRTAQAVRAGLRYRVLEALSRWPAATPADLEGLATRLGWDLVGRFTAVVAPATGWSELDVVNPSSRSWSVTAAAPPGTWTSSIAAGWATSLSRSPKAARPGPSWSPCRDAWPRRRWESG